MAIVVISQKELYVAAQTDSFDVERNAVWVSSSENQRVTEKCE